MDAYDLTPHIFLIAQLTAERITIAPDTSQLILRSTGKAKRNETRQHSNLNHISMDYCIIQWHNISLKVMVTILSYGYPHVCTSSHSSHSSPSIQSWKVRKNDGR